MVSFVIGGVQKGGTTALARYLGAHPDVCLPRTKEAHVFDSPEFDEDWSADDVDRAYYSHWPEGHSDRQLHGDATPLYVFHPRLIARIARYNPAMRWIILLRDPVDRAVSQFHMERARGWERWPLWAAVLLERFRVRGHRNDLSHRSPLVNHGYIARGRYVRQLDVLHRHVPAKQVLILRSLDLRTRPAETMQKVYDFLGLAPPARLPAFEPVFIGNYDGQRGDRWSRGWLRLMFQRELKELKRRYGIDFD